MSEDRREAILDRLVQVAGTIVSPGSVFRNTIDIPEQKLPAVAILDGDEEADDSGFGRGRPSNAGTVMALTPHLVLKLQASPEKVGPALSEYRAAILKAILEDASLIALSKDGDIRYHGMETDLGVGRSMTGGAAFLFEFRYYLRPAKL